MNSDGPSQSGMRRRAGVPEQVPRAFRLGAQALQPRRSRHQFHPTPSSGHSFTLLEMVISLGLLALLAGLAIMSATAITNSWSRLERRQQQFAELMRVDRTLDTMLTSIVPLSWHNADNDVLPFFRGRSDSIRFAYRHRVTDPDEGALRFVYLEAVDGELRAYYTARPVLDEDALFSDGRVSVLADGVAGIAIQYAVIRRGMAVDEPPEWVDQWDAEEWPIQERQTQLRPLAVRLEVEWQDGRVETWLRRLPGNSQYERRGRWTPLNADI